MQWEHLKLWTTSMLEGGNMEQDAELKGRPLCTGQNLQNGFQEIALHTGKPQVSLLSAEVHLNACDRSVSTTAIV